MSVSRGAVAAIVSAFLVLAGTLGYSVWSYTRPTEEVADIQAKADAFREQIAATNSAAEKAELDKTTFQVAPTPGQPYRVLFAGDSVTVGVGASSEKQGYREVILAELRKRGDIQPTVAATSGATTAEVAPAALAAGDAFDLLIVELGTNDMERTDPAKFKADYTTLITGLRTKSPNAALVCAGLWQPTAAAKTFDEAVAQACDAAGGQYRPLGSIFVTATNRPGSGDTFHPNDAGHSKIASQMLTALRFS